MWYRWALLSKKLFIWKKGWFFPRPLAQNFKMIFIFMYNKHLQMMFRCKMARRAGLWKKEWSFGELLADRCSCRCNPTAKPTHYHSTNFNENSIKSQILIHCSAKRLKNVFYSILNASIYLHLFEHSHRKGFKKDNRYDHKIV